MIFAVRLLPTGNKFGPQRTLRTRRGVGIGDSDDAVFEVDGIEVEQETERDFAELQVGENLRCMNWSELVYRLELDDE